MKRAIVCLCLICAGCGPPMSDRDKVLFGTMLAAQWADYETTRRCISVGGHELNPLLPDRPSNDELAVFKVGVSLVWWGLGELYPDDREAIFTFAALTAGGAAIWNNYTYEHNR